MTEKSQQEKRRDIRLSPAQMVQPGMNGVTDAQAREAVARSAAQSSDLEEEYRYVVTDLRRIGVIALAMLAVLIALALLLP